MEHPEASWSVLEAGASWKRDVGSKVHRAVLVCPVWGADSERVVGSRDSATGASKNILDHPGGQRLFDSPESIVLSTGVKFEEVLLRYLVRSLVKSKV